MPTRRRGFGMMVVGLQPRSILLTFGSNGAARQEPTAAEEEESLLQEWSDTQDGWLPSPAVLQRRVWFSAVTVEASLVCPQGI
jgi:hypothetical protein